MSLSSGIKRLLDRLCDLEKRLMDIEERLDELVGIEYEVGIDQIGFEVDDPGEFDEDESEYRKGK